jgi:hypothetical protein
MSNNSNKVSANKDKVHVEEKIIINEAAEPQVPQTRGEVATQEEMRILLLQQQQQQQQQQLVWLLFIVYY